MKYVQFDCTKREKRNTHVLMVEIYITDNVLPYHIRKMFHTANPFYYKHMPSSNL